MTQSSSKRFDSDEDCLMFLYDACSDFTFELKKPIYLFSNVISKEFPNGLFDVIDMTRSSVNYYQVPCASNAT
jgi:hypothetical protein